MPLKTNSEVIPTETNKPGQKRRSSKYAETIQVPVYVPNIPEPTCRADLIPHWMKLSFDAKTANKMLWITDSGYKVCRMTEEVCPVLDRPERYEYSPQVLCAEGIWKMRAYWEVEFTGWVAIGATYERAGRRASCGPSGLGENEESWALCWSGTRYQLWFNGVYQDIMDCPYSSTIGVYIDQPAKIINFYAIIGEGAEREAKLVHKVTTTSDQKILPGFWMGIKSSCTLLKTPE